ncbi:MAG: ABC transporter ATP-binding protein [Peptococcus niger]|nr:ABC transporter ATP-binding protein [Peptococcus niger]
MIEFQNVSFSYGKEKTLGSLKNISLTIPNGQVVVFCGASGSGKTTMTRLVNGLIPHFFEGSLTGSCRIDGKNNSDIELWQIAAKVGNVFQNPRSQFFNVEVQSEVTFGCENMGFPREECLKRCNEATKQVHIENLIGKSLFELSGGEKQKVACASAAAQGTDIIVLDEPTSNLDVRSISDLGEIIGQWKSEGKTVLIAEHRLKWLLPYADRFICFKDGEITADYQTNAFVNLFEDARRDFGLRAITPVVFEPRENVPPDDMIFIEKLSFSYRSQKMLDIEKLEIPMGMTIGVVGGNGAGKTTFARCLAGLNKAKGHISFHEDKSLSRKTRLNQIYVVFQDVNHQLFTEDLMEEMLLSMDTEDDNARETAHNVLDRLGLSAMEERHPLSLSGGQKQRAAIGSALVSGRPIIIYDEPTSGLDYGYMTQFAEALQICKEQGVTQLIVSHDPELLNLVCDYCIAIENGKVVWDGPMNEENCGKLTSFFGE